MQTYRHKKIERIDLHADYPCPCCRRGQLSLITLTDALGCERCQEIFVLHEDGYLLEGLKTAYPYPKKWYWTGTQWTIKSPPQQWFQVFPVMRLITIALLFALLVVFISLILPIVLPLSYGWWIFVLGMVIGFSIIFLNRFQG